MENNAARWIRVNLNEPTFDVRDAYHFLAAKVLNGVLVAGGILLGIVAGWYETSSSLPYLPLKSIIGLFTFRCRNSSRRPRHPQQKLYMRRMRASRCWKNLTSMRAVTEIMMCKNILVGVP